MNIHFELDGLDDVADEAFKVESCKINVSLTVAAVAGKQRFFTLTGLVHEITGVKVAQKKGKQTVSLKLAKKEKKTWHKLLDAADVDDTANSNTDITSCVSQTTMSDFSKNLEGPSHSEKEEAIDDHTHSMDSHKTQCEKGCWVDLRADTGTLFLHGKIVMEQHNSTPSPSQIMKRQADSLKKRKFLGVGRRRMGTSCKQHDQHELE